MDNKNLINIDFFIQKLKNIQAHSGLNLTQFLDFICISRQLLSKWAKHQSSPTIERINEIAKILNIPAYQLLIDNPTNTIEVNKDTIQSLKFTYNGETLTDKQNLIIAQTLYFNILGQLHSDNLDDFLKNNDV